MFNTNQINTQANSIQRIRYFPVELYCANMMPNTKYNVFMDGQQVNDFCKPFGGTLGDDIIADNNGRITVQLMLGIAYNQSFLVNQTVDETGLVSTAKTVTFVDPHGRESVTYLPIVLKAN